MPDGVNAILRRTHDEREARLQAFADELAETVAARKAIAKALGISKRSPAAPKQLTAGPSTPRVADTSKGMNADIITAVKASLDPLTGPQIAEALKLDWKPWIGAQLGRLVAAGELIKTNAEGDVSTYGMPQHLDRPDPAENGVS